MKKRNKYGQYRKHTLAECITFPILMLVMVGAFGLATRGNKQPVEVVSVAHAQEVQPSGKVPSIEQLCGLDDVVCQGEKTIETANIPVSIKSNPVAKQIYAIAKEENFKWPDYLVRLAYAESGLNPLATHNNRNGTIDRGIMQWNSVHQNISEACAFDVDCSVRLAITFINDGKQGIWVTDKVVKYQKFE